MKPVGQIKPQTARPSKVPVKSKKPVTKNGKRPVAIVFWREPNGHDEMAAGHE